MSLLLDSICLEAPAPGHHSMALVPSLRQTLESPGGLDDTHHVGPIPRLSVSAGVGWGPRSGVSNKFPGDADPAGPGTHSEGR